MKTDKLLKKQMKTTDWISHYRNTYYDSALSVSSGVKNKKLGTMIYLKKTKSAEAKRRRIKINNKEIEYTLKRRRGAKSVRLAIYASGAFVVTAPRWYPVYVINKFLAEKAGWIYNKLKDVDFEQLDLKKKIEKMSYKAQKESARVIIRERLEFFNRYYNFEYSRVSVKNQKSCWGSASRKENLNFNYKVANLPEDLRDYIIAHELCHLGELNHSKNFWKLVEIVIPSYKERRRKLRAYNLKLLI